MTVSFNQQGARISLIHSLLPDDIVLVKNLENGVEEEFRVVGAFQQVFGNRREWGVEAINPESGIWGVEFAPHDDSAQPKVLIECAACKTAAQSTLSSIEYEVLLATGLISRHCERCNETTRWKPSAQAVTEEILIRSNKARRQGHQEVRRARRLKLTMQLRVRNSWGVVDIAQNARCFQAGPLLRQQPSAFPPGTRSISPCPYAKSQTPVETQGQDYLDRRKAPPAGFTESSTSVDGVCGHRRSTPIHLSAPSRQAERLIHESNGRRLQGQHKENDPIERVAANERRHPGFIPYRGEQGNARSV